MSEIFLTQQEADMLLQMEKHRVDDREWELPKPGTKSIIQLVSFDKREKFILDMSQQAINTFKIKYQNRARVNVILARLELGGAPHQNPDGEIVDAPHVHLFREGFGDKWAFPLSQDDFSNPIR